MQTALEFLERRCERHWWFREPRVPRDLVLEFVTCGRDRWWCHRRAQSLVVDCYYALGMDERDLPEPVWEPLPPHTNRGRSRVSRQAA